MTHPAAAFTPHTEPGLLERIACALEDTGYIHLREVFDAPTAEGLLAHCKTLNIDRFTPAAIGRDQTQGLNQEIRRDRIRWLDPGPEVLAPYFSWIEALRIHLNRRLFLGLGEYECHFAWYSAGAFYRKHLDAFRGRRSRVVSSILYLNRDWRPEHGGELLLYAPATPPATEDRLLERLAPTFGSMVLFLSEEFPHEVLPTAVDRISLTGWFRVGGEVRV